MPAPEPVLGEKKNSSYSLSPQRRKISLQQLKVGDILFLQLSESCPCLLSFPCISLVCFVQMTFGRNKKKKNLNQQSKLYGGLRVYPSLILNI